MNGLWTFRSSNMSRGAAETTQLRTNLEDQLGRLVDQLADLEKVPSVASFSCYSILAAKPTIVNDRSPMNRISF